MKRILSVLLILFFNTAFANFDAIGNTYAIVETSALVWIESRLKELEESGEIAKQQAKFQEQTLAAIDRPKPVAGLTKTIEARMFEHDLTVTVPHDITDYNGQLIHAAGTKVNPLTRLITQKALLFFDGDDEEQVAWALRTRNERNNLAKLVLTNGSVSQVANANNTRVFFDQSGRLTKKFGITQIPALVEQKGDKLRISEIKL